MPIPFTRLCHCATQTTDNTIIIYVDMTDSGMRVIKLRLEVELLILLIWSYLQQASILKYLQDIENTQLEPFYT